MKVILFYLGLLPICLYGQKEIAQKVDSLKYVDEMPYICRVDVQNQTGLSLGCGDKIFWNVVVLKEKVIPFLLEKLDDSTTTKAIVNYVGYNYTVADVAYIALEEIIHGIPTFELLPVDFDELGCGYCSYWEHLNLDFNNRVNFKQAVMNWYTLNKANLVWVENDDFLICDCSGKHPNRGHYELLN